MVALTGIEPVKFQFSSVQLSLSRYVFSLVQFAQTAKNPLWTADVVTRESLLTVLVQAAADTLSRNKILLPPEAHES
jgi:hypothetical protein